MSNRSVFHCQCLFSLFSPSPLPPPPCIGKRVLIMILIKVAKFADHCWLYGRILGLRFNFCQLRSLIYLKFQMGFEKKNSVPQLLSARPRYLFLNYFSLNHHLNSGSIEFACKPDNVIRNCGSWHRQQFKIFGSSNVLLWLINAIIIFNIVSLYCLITMKRTNWLIKVR